MSFYAEHQTLKNMNNHCLSSICQCQIRNLFFFFASCYIFIV